MILSALSRIPDNDLLHFVIAGTGAEEQRLKAFVHNHGLQQSVTFVGFVPDADLSALYCLADCFIIAGTAELQSIVTMEAMASGLPILAVRAVALPELVRDGQNGLLFQPDDAPGLADRIVRMFSDDALRQQMAEKSLEFIARHDIEYILGQFEALYARATGGDDSNVTLMPV